MRRIVGSIVGLGVVALLALAWVPGAVTTWHHPLVAGDGRSVEVLVSIAHCGRRTDVGDLDVQETQSRVTITARRAAGIRWPHLRLSCSDVGFSRRTTVQLESPLGERELLDGGCLDGPCSREPREGSSDA